MNRNRSCIAGALLALLGLVSVTAIAAPPTRADIGARADAYLKARAASGAFSGAVLLARGDEVLFSAAYGFANETSGTANAVNTRFPVASVTKSFTAALVMKMVHEGRFALTDPICRHLSPCPSHWQSVTIEHLLKHTSGISDYARTADFPRKMGERRTVETLIAEFRDRPLESAPGAKYRYSNSGYVLLGAILEKAGGKPFGELLRGAFVEPLGLRGSGVEDSAVPVRGLATGYVPAGVRNQPSEFVDPSWLYAAGAIYSTVGDVFAWSRALETGRLIPAALVEEMWSPAHGAYGYGWQLLAPSPQTLGRRLAFHAGGTTGFASDLLIYPDDDVTVILLANLLPVPLADMSRDLSAIVFGEKYELPLPRRAAEIDASVYSDYVGDYRLAPNVIIHVSKEGDQLAVQATGQRKDFAIPESASSFYSRISPVRLSFTRDAAGKVTGLVLHEATRELTAARE